MRFLTCGSVDDGKSTLIGRLLHDSGSVFDDQLEALRRGGSAAGAAEGDVNFALLVDGLQAEREQGITIDVAYRYFAGRRRKYIIVDAPGHEQYTRNMATGASHCDLAVILVDARRGMTDQTRRHAFIATLLGIRHAVVAVNKMDAVDWSEARFEEIRDEFTRFAARLQIGDLDFIPMSALLGDNVVRASESMPWYQGPPLLDYLETVHVASDRNLIDLRLPVQLVLRDDSGGRWYAGSMASGILRRGDTVVVLPSRRTATVAAIRGVDGDVAEAVPPMAVTVALDADVDVARGDMLAHPNNAPRTAHDVEAMVVWMGEKPLAEGDRYVVKQTTVQTPATVAALRYRINVATLRREECDGLALNEIGRVRIETSRPLSFDAYSRNRATGSFIVIDRVSNATVGAGMIVDRDPAVAETAGTEAVESMPTSISPPERAQRLGHQPLIVWMERQAGEPLDRALELERRLFDAGVNAHVLDGDAVAATAETAARFHALGLVTVVVASFPPPASLLAAAAVLQVPAGADPGALAAAVAERVRV